MASGGTLSITFENDLFYKTDRDYTNGVELSWAPSEAVGPDTFPGSIARALPFFEDSEYVRVSYGAGQLMFTPEHTRLANPLPHERPYAGYLYGAVAFTRTGIERQDQWRAQLGMVGPSSLAADSQKFFHAIRDFDMPAGWHTQLRDEPGLILTYERTYNFPLVSNRFGPHLDINPHFGGAIGNVFDYVNAGGIARLGLNMPKDTSPPVIEPSPSGSAFYQPRGQFGGYLFIGMEGRFVARNLFLDGNSFHASRSVEKKFLVADFLFGTVMAFNNLQLSYVHMFRSAEHKNQRDFDQFGRLSLAINL